MLKEGEKGEVKRYVEDIGLCVMEWGERGRRGEELIEEMK